MRGRRTVRGSDFGETVTITMTVPIAIGGAHEAAAVWLSLTRNPALDHLLSSFNLTTLHPLW
jgi:hypothetical protein